MTTVEIYTTPLCGFCNAAKRLLAQKDAAVAETDVTAPEARRAMRERAGGNTVPQIFIGGTHIGGCDELYALDRAGKLDPMLAAA